MELMGVLMPSEISKLPYRPHAEDKVPGGVAKAAILMPAGLYARLGLACGDRAGMVQALRAGLPVSIVNRLADELGISQNALLGYIRLPSATLTRRRAQKRLSVEESDRVYRVVVAYRAALQLFEGDVNAARRWLNEPAKALGGNTPLEHLDTEAGAEAVQDLVVRLEQGVIS